MGDFTRVGPGSTDKQIFVGNKLLQKKCQGLICTTNQLNLAEKIFLQIIIAGGGFYEAGGKFNGALRGVVCSPH